jgi:[acyl-carrier-protein] S-malonyltransferase
MNTALLFPGQGSQRVGMGRDLAIKYDVAKQTYAEADDVLGFPLSKLCFEGPEDDLTLTKHTQPAILTTSVAVFRVLREKGLAFDIVAGHSLGEWSALVAAGALELRDAVKLTHLRGTFMQEAVPVGTGAMAALMGLDVAAARAVCEKCSTPGEPVEPANLNGAAQIVISGHAAAVDRAIIEAKAAGAKRAVKLQVSAPFHCSLMKPAAERLAAALAEITIKAPSVPVVANVTAEPTQDPARIKQLLVEQVTAPVRWEESIQAIAKLGVTTAYELGSGAVLKGLVKRIAETITVTTIGEPHETEAFTA